MTSSATAKWLASGSAQSISQTVSCLLADAGLDLHAVAQQVVDIAVGLVQVAAAAERRRLVELVERLG